MDSSPIGTDFDDVSKQTAVRGKAYRHLQMLNGRKSITKSDEPWRGVVPPKTSKIKLESKCSKKYHSLRNGLT